MARYEDLSETEAVAHMDAYVATLPRRLAWLEAELTAWDLTEVSDDLYVNRGAQALSASGTPFRKPDIETGFDDLPPPDEDPSVVLSNARTSHM